MAPKTDPRHVSNPTSLPKTTIRPDQAKPIPPAPRKK
jgi:hypothetical protein